MRNLTYILLFICSIGFGQQFARPDGNITQIETVGSYTAIDEVSFSDVDYITGNDNVVATYECSLSNPTDPVVHTGHTVRIRIGKADTGVADSDTGNSVSVNAFLFQGTTQIKELVNVAVGVWIDYTINLTTIEASNITDYTDLRIRFVSTNSGGSPANRRGMAISWAELEVPDVSSTRRIFNIN